MFAATAEDCASQTVGYTTFSVEAGKWYQFGTQFKDTGSETDEVDINEFIKVTGMTAEAFPQCVSSGTCPEIQVWNGSGYTYYRYINNATGESAPCWASGKTKVSQKLKLGAGFWLHAPNAEPGATVMFKGEVKATDATMIINVGDTAFVQISNPFPVALKQSMITTTGLTAEAFPGCVSSGTCPEMQVWNGSGYTYYRYISNATGESAPCWASGKTKVDQIAGVGNAFWVKSNQKGTLTIDINK